MSDIQEISIGSKEEGDALGYGNGNDSSSVSKEEVEEQIRRYEEKVEQFKKKSPAMAEVFSNKIEELKELLKTME